jgi:hypothetical protein
MQSVYDHPETENTGFICTITLGRQCNLLGKNILFLNIISLDCRKGTWNPTHAKLCGQLRGSLPCCLVPQNAGKQSFWILHHQSRI